MALGYIIIRSPYTPYSIYLRETIRLEGVCGEASGLKIEEVAGYIGSLTRVLVSKSPCELWSKHLKGAYTRDYIGDSQGDTRGFDYSSCCFET